MTVPPAPPPPESLPPPLAAIAEVHAGHGPLALTTAAALCGVAPRPLSPGFVWADFGCGHGLTACLQAAAHPQGRFIGVDLDPRALDTGRSLAQAAFLANVDLIEGDVARLHALDLPPLDVAVLHGMLSWLDVEQRQAALSAIAGLLKPGGLLLASYDALPGRAALVPLRDLLFSVTASVETDPVARARAALNWLRHMRGKPVAFFADNPAVAEAVDRLCALGPLHVARAFFGGTLRPHHFAQILAEVQAQGLTFVGRAEAFLNTTDLAVPSALRPELRAAQSRAEFEAKRDFLRNEAFRRDLYVKGAPLDNAEAREALLDGLTVGPADPPGPANTSVAFGSVAMDYAGAPFDSLRRVLAEGARPVAALIADPHLDLPPDQIREAVRLMLAGGLIRAYARPAEPATADTLATATAQADDGRPWHMPHPVNRIMARTLGVGGATVPLVSTEMGDTLVLDNRDALLLAALCEVGPTGAVDRALEILNREGLAADRKRWTETLSARFHPLMTERLPWLVGLGILAPL